MREQELDRPTPTVSSAFLFIFQNDDRNVSYETENDVWQRSKSPSAETEFWILSHLYVERSEDILPRL